MLLVLRILAYLFVIVIGAALAVFLVTRDRRYLRFAIRSFKLAALLVVILLGLLALEQLIFVL
jgi:hypothetical protein